MKKLLLVILLIANITTLSFALSDELKFDMKKTKFIKQMKEKNYSGALSTLKVLRDIGKPLPSSILYFEGKALYETKNYSKAYDVLASYAGNGKKVKYYKDTVNLLISAEEAIESQRKARLDARKKEKARIARKKEEERKARIVREEKARLEALIVKDKYDNKYIKVTSPYTGRVWLDRNIGAKRVCTAYDDTQCYGEYYRWDSANDICPNGYILPTKNDLAAETIEQGVYNREDALNNFLKLPAAGYRKSDGDIRGDGSYGRIWSSSIKGNNAWRLDINEDNAKWRGGYLYVGRSVRCLKD